MHISSVRAAVGYAQVTPLGGGRSLVGDGVIDDWVREGYLPGITDIQDRRIRQLIDRPVPCPLGDGWELAHVERTIGGEGYDFILVSQGDSGRQTLDLNTDSHRLRLHTTNLDAGCGHWIVADYESDTGRVVPGSIKEAVGGPYDSWSDVVRK
ncbi:MAG: hypothetical protein HY319_15020 [Armatimonadetes bacterium]|nr:hypothetical protein [Armatimonadota bacterium]